MRVSTFLLASAIAAAAPGVASAQDLISTAEPDFVLELAKGFGSAALEKDSGGDPMVSGRMQGLKYVIFFYGCKEGANCRSIQFSAGYTDAFSAEKANEWNAKFRWIRASSKDGSNFKMDIDFAGGVTREHIEAQFATWESFITDIKDFVAQ